MKKIMTISLLIALFYSIFVFAYTQDVSKDEACNIANALGIINISALSPIINERMVIEREIVNVYGIPFLFTLYYRDGMFFESVSLLQEYTDEAVYPSLEPEENILNALFEISNRRIQSMLDENGSCVGISPSNSGGIIFAQGSSSGPFFGQHSTGTATVQVWGNHVSSTSVWLAGIYTHASTTISNVVIRAIAGSIFMPAEQITISKAVTRHASALSVGFTFPGVANNQSFFSETFHNVIYVNMFRPGSFGGSWNLPLFSAFWQDLVTMETHISVAHRNGHHIHSTGATTTTTVRAIG